MSTRTAAIDINSLACRTNDPELFFPETAAQVVSAKKLCDGCPLAAPCLQGAIERKEPWGIWGGEHFRNGVIAVKRRRGPKPKAVIKAERAAAEQAAQAVAAEAERTVIAQHALVALVAA